jgi:RimJ/RimL family protein N-acetyltransferase
VHLEPLTQAHVPGLVRAANIDRSSYGFTRVPDDERSMSEFVSAVTTEQAEGTCVPFAIVSTRDSLVVGTTRFLDLQYWPLPGDTRARSLPSVGEIGGTWLAAPSQGNGTNREAKVLMLDHAFDQWGTWRIRFQTDARNTRSRTALERLGARFEGVQRAHKLAADGTLRDTAWYSILGEEWPASRRRLT